MEPTVLDSLPNEKTNISKFKLDKNIETQHTFSKNNSSTDNQKFSQNNEGSEIMANVETNYLRRKCNFQRI